MKHQYPFPQGTLNFKHTPWHYRIAGPFSVPNFAGGAYSTVLALQTFVRKLSAGDVSVTFSTNLELEKDGHRLEVDFALWFARDRHLRENESPRFVVGEAKSFALDAIDLHDALKMKRLACLVPGTFLTFAVLKEELSSNERSLLRRLALWGRKLLPSGDQRAPVIVLTGPELFAEHYVSKLWEDAGANAASLISPAYIRMDDLPTLARLTQHLYLDL